MTVRSSLLLLTLCLAAPVLAGDPAAGQRLYREGLLANGSPVSAQRLGTTEAAADLLACIKCHRRSGLGSRESEIVIPPITGPALFSRPVPRPLARHKYPARPTRAESREAYDDASLLRAITDGIDSSGRPLDKLMPRYRLDPENRRNLLAYLHTLSSSPAPGIGDNSMRLATIVTPDADETRRRVVAETLQAWASHGALSNLDIDVDVWTLHGAPETWRSQLEAAFSAHPVFAVLSGVGGSTWQPVAEFCEARELPCLFPVLDAAPEKRRGYYTVYLDSGLPLEAELLAAYLRRAAHPEILQLFEDEAGKQAADEVCTLAGIEPCITLPWAPAGDERLAGKQIVAWLKPASLAALIGRLPSTQPGLIASARLAPPESVELSADKRPLLRWISTRVDPRRAAAYHAVWLQPWLNQLQLPPDHTSLRAEIYTATYFFADALARMRGAWNQDYLLETLEDGHYTQAAGRTYLSLSLAPGQRVLAKAGHLLGYQPPKYQDLGPVSGHILP